jgi:hypothetical protein
VALRVRVVPFRTAWAVIPAGRGAVSTTDWMRRPTAPARGAAPSLTGRSSVRVIWSGTHISALQTRKVARTLSGTVAPGFAEAGTSIGTGRKTSPS